MRKYVFTICFFLLSSVAMMAAPATTADTLSTEPDELPERTRYYKEKYEESYNSSFENVWSSIKEVLEEMGAHIATQKYSQNDEGFYKGTIRSDAWVFSEGTDSTYRLLQKYSYDMKVIPGSIWVNGRLEFKFKVTEVSPDNVALVMTTKMSAHETYVTEIVHFWQSNGLLEKQFLESLNAKIAAKGN